MARVWDPKAKKWVDKPASQNPSARNKVGAANKPTSNFSVAFSAPTAQGLTPEKTAGLPMSMTPEEAQGYSDFTSEYGTSGSLRDILGTSDGSGEPSRAQSSAWGIRAAQPLEQAGRTAQTAYGTRADQQAAAMRGLYDPMFAEQEKVVRGLRGQAMAAYDPYFAQREAAANAQRQAAIDFLEKQYGGSQATIQQATQAALAAIPAAQAYSNVPLVELQQRANPLLGVLGNFGADQQAVQQQSAQDAVLAGQLAQLARGSAGQLQQAQEAMRSAAQQDLTFGQSQALQQLALNRLAQMGGIDAARNQILADVAGERARLGADYASQEATGLADIAKARAGANVDVEQARQGLLNEGLAALLGGQTSAAEQLAKTIADYGGQVPKSFAQLPKSLQPKTGKGKGKGKGGKK